MKNLKLLLPRYFSILENDLEAKYLISKKIPADFSKSDSTKSLWKKHEYSIKNNEVGKSNVSSSLLDLKIELATRIFRSCVFCEKRCKVDRNISSGQCNVREARIYSEFLHMGEESFLIPSYTIFFSGCTFNCVFCQNWDISQQICGLSIKHKDLIFLIDKRIKEGAKNINWVGGDPTSNLLYILLVLKECKANIVQVWNSNMYCSVETMKLLDGVIDIYLTDFKYGNDFCAKRLSKIDNYTGIIKRNHKLAYDFGEVVIRHLIMPNHLDCCSVKILDWISKNLDDAVVNLMAQYRPQYEAYKFLDISKPLSIDDYYNLKNYAKKLGIYLI